MKHKENLDIKLQNFHHEAGFMMMVIPVFLLLFSFFVAAMLKETEPNEFYFETSVQHNMEDVRTALAAYAHRNFRIPCPAAPDATAANAGAEAKTGVDCTSPVGILPYRELGLPESAAKDKWGHFYTYKVSLNFTREVDTAATMIDDMGNVVDKYETIDGLLVPVDAVANYVHKLCQTHNWVDPNVSQYSDINGVPQTLSTSKTLNKNFYKANFCCASNVVLTTPSVPTGGSSGSITAAKYAGTTAVNTLSMKPDGADGSDDPIALNYSYEFMDPLALAVDAPNPAAMLQHNYWANQGMLELDRDPDDPKYGKAGFLFQTQTYNVGGETVVFEGLGMNKEGWSGAWGKNYKNAVGLEFVDPSIQADTVTLNLTDVNPGDWNSPLETSMLIEDASGNVIPFSYILQSPAHVDPPYEEHLTIAISDILGDANQPHLVNRSGHKIKYYEYSSGSDPLLVEYDLNEATADAYFNANKEAFKQALIDNGTIPLSKVDADGNGTLSSAEKSAYVMNSDDIKDLKINKVKFNTAYASLGFKSVSYSSSAPPSLPSLGQAYGDLSILKEDGTPVLTPRTALDSYVGTSTIVPASDAIPQDFEAPAYALISHGADGEGAFQAGSTIPIDNIPNGDESLFEAENHSTPNVVYDMRKISADAVGNKYDDIVMWDSQLTLYNSLRNGTCESAQAL